MARRELDSDLAAGVACPTTSTGPSLRDTLDEQGETVRVLPDACTDVMWVDGVLKVAGPDKTVSPS